jgi:hypothetical protein
MPTARAEVEASCARVLADPELRPEAVAARVEVNASYFLDGRPGEALTALLTALEDQSVQAVAQDDPGNWARQTLTRIREWVGVSSANNNGPLNATISEWQRSRLSRAMKSGAEKLAEEWDRKLAQSAAALMEHPGRRVAAAEAALQQFAQYCQEFVGAYGTRLVQEAPRTQQAWNQLEGALEGCLAGPGGFSLFGNRSRRLLRLFMDRLAAFARQRLVEEGVSAGQQFFAFLRGKLNDRLRDMGLIRQRLRYLQDNLETPPDEADEPVTTTPHGSDSGSSKSPPASTESFWESIRTSSTARVVLPDGEEDLERAAARFLSTLSPEHWTQLDQALQDRVLVHLGGLHEVCMKSGDLARSLALPLLDQAATCLSEHLPITDVAEIELSAAKGRHDLVMTQIQAYYSSAAPLVTGRDTVGGQLSFLLVPASDAGRAFGESAQQAVPDLELVRVPGQAHLMFCREQGALTPDDLQRLFRPCRDSYVNAMVVPVASPHARFDIVDWVPLDP